MLCIIQSYFSLDAIGLQGYKACLEACELLESAQTYQAWLLPSPAEHTTDVWDLWRCCSRPNAMLQRCGLDMLQDRTQDMENYTTCYLRIP